MRRIGVAREYRRLRADGLAGAVVSVDRRAPRRSRGRGCLCRSADVDGPNGGGGQVIGVVTGRMLGVLAYGSGVRIQGAGFELVEVTQEQRWD